jgi:predicted RNase H-related nuclease YkuK (DUF458 family)
MFKKIALEIQNNEHCNITIGTDSQRHDGKSKFVTVVCIHNVGKGGKFFYAIDYTENIKDIRYKIYTETEHSIDLTKRLTNYLFDLELEFNIAIHADIGRSKKGRTYDMIKEIVGWVNSEGFECHFKPDSYTASCVADKITKPI